MKCVSSAPTNVLVNGSSSGVFKLKRNLCQGDPLSLFHYLLVVEGLNVLVNKVLQAGLLESAELGQDKLKVSHLQYTDDTIFLTSGDPKNGRAMKSFLQNFEQLFELQVNFSKCSLVCINIDKNQTDQLAELLGCSVGSTPLSYLGIKVGMHHKRFAE